MSGSFNDTYQQPNGIALIINDSPMSRFQIWAVALCILISALDGFDLMAVAFTASSIARDWSMRATDVGMLFSAGLFGMAVGAVLISPIGDRKGRRPLILGCLVTIGLTMLVSAVTQELWQLIVVRVIAGVAIGGLIASLNVMVAEYSSSRRRALCIGVMALGVPLGAATGGAASIYLIGSFGWRSIFLLGGVLTLAVIPLTYKMLPESLSFLLVRRSPKTLSKVNALLGRMKHSPIAELPEQSADEVNHKPGLVELFRGQHRTATILMSAIYMSVMLAIYFSVNWTPKILTELAFSDAGGISASMMMNIFGAFSCLAMGASVSKYGLRPVATLIYMGMFGSLVWFGFAPATSSALLVATALMGFFMFSGTAVSYALVPEVFPPQVRLTAMGACLAFGRAGGVLGPYLAGVMMDNGFSRPIYCLVLALPTLLAVVLLYFLRALSQRSTETEKVSADQADLQHTRDADLVVSSRLNRNA